MNSDERLIRMMEGGLNTSSKLSNRLTSTNATMKSSDDMTEVQTKKMSFNDFKRKYSRERISSISKGNRKGSILLVDSSDEDSVFSDKDTSVFPIQEDLEENEADNIGYNNNCDESIYKYVFEEDSDNEDDHVAKKAKSEPKFSLINSKEITNFDSKLSSLNSNKLFQMSQEQPYPDQCLRNCSTSNFLRANSIPSQMQYSMINPINYSNMSYMYPNSYLTSHFQNYNMMRMSFHNQTQNLQNSMQFNHNHSFYPAQTISSYSTKTDSDFIKSSSCIYPNPQTQASDKSLRDSISLELIMMMLEDKITSKTEITFNDYNIFLKERLLSLISSKESSKKMQKCICLFTPEVINLILNEILPNIISSIKNNFCNYFYQRFFKNLNSQQRLKVLWLFKENHFFSLCCLKTGVYLVISIIEKVSTIDEMNLIDSVLGDRLMELLTNPNGYRVLEKITLRFEEKYFSHIFNPIFANFVMYSKDPSACEVLKVLLSKINKNNKLCKMFAQLISENLLELASDKVATSIVVASLYNLKHSHKQFIFKASYKIMTELVINENAVKVVDRLIDFNCEPTIDSIIKSLNNNSEKLKLLNNEVFISTLSKLLNSSPDSKRNNLIEATDKSMQQLSSPCQNKLRKIMNCTFAGNLIKSDSSDENECHYSSQDYV